MMKKKTFLLVTIGLIILVVFIVAGCSSSTNGEDVVYEINNDGTTDEDDGIKTSINVRIQNTNDVAWSYKQNFVNWMIKGGKTFGLGRHTNDNGDYVAIYAALRFTNVFIPEGALIKSAHIYWYPHKDLDSDIRLLQDIYAEKAANSLPFNLSDNETGRPDLRARTSSVCSQYELDSWDRNIEYKVPKDLKDLVQEIVNIPGWVPGNAMTFFFTNCASDTNGIEYKGYRTVIGYDPDGLGPLFSPRLVVEFDPPAMD